MDKIKILAFGGSLRKNSYNWKLLEYAKEIAPQDAEVELFEIGNLPLFNDDFELSLPSEVNEFKNKIKNADALLIATPEYNYSIPGVLKNAIDWASRPVGQNSFNDKPAGIMSASRGMLGGIRAQYILRQSFVALNIHAVNYPEVVVPFAGQKFDDADGRLTDEHTKEKISELIESLIKWTKRIK